MWLLGTIPSEFGLLSSMTGMYLPVNNLTGTIPTELGLLSRLQVLTLDQNSLEGTEALVDE